ncbi:MAG: 3-hydroxylacyl-ACP dehydratase [Hydrogenophilales bacterium 12-61-10]|nr:MAG: 3-hydroxylacyl-ACP dehydratase [Hydrogenophilales bacterium 12-61-10]OYX31650.1 MAG: 3-hydroxylacyl-ACP dehydratase [Hydrogenophilales bacterium 32-62-9]
MPLDHTWLLAHLPHQGSMCLLDRVDSWDAQHIQCSASSHRAPDNPLRAHGRLGAACGIEYAAQAMAAHGALLAAADSAPRVGYLASVRAVELKVTRLDDIAADLRIEAERVSGDDNTILYAFSVLADHSLLLSGRAIVVLDATLLDTTQTGSST